MTISGFILMLRGWQTRTIFSPTLKYFPWVLKLVWSCWNFICHLICFLIAVVLQLYTNIGFILKMLAVYNAEHWTALCSLLLDLHSMPLLSYKCTSRAFADTHRIVCHKCASLLKLNLFNLWGAVVCYQMATQKLKSTCREQCKQVAVSSMNPAYIEDCIITRWILCRHKNHHKSFCLGSR